MTAAPRQNEPIWEYTGIQALRAIAAFAVVFGHSLNFLWQEHGRLPFAVEDFQGAIGVDIFFVISGFVMMISAPRLLAHYHPTETFLWRRLLRVAPLYWLITAAKLIAVAAIPMARVHVHPTTWNVVASFLFLPSRNSAGEIRPFVPVGWTLNFEMLFYLLFACALNRRHGLTRILLPALCLLSILSVFRTPASPAWTSLADPIVLEFAAGVGIARLAQSRRLPNAVWASISILCGAGSILLMKPGLRLLTERVLWWGIPAALIVLGVVALEPALRNGLPRWLLLLGRASYSIYLIQTLVFPLVEEAAATLRASMPNVTQLQLGFGIVCLSLVLAAVAGTATHLLVEQPITQFLKKTFGPGRIAPIARQT